MFDPGWHVPDPITPFVWTELSAFGSSSITAMAALLVEASALRPVRWCPGGMWRGCFVWRSDRCNVLIRRDVSLSSYYWSLVSERSSEIHEQLNFFNSLRARWWRPWGWGNSWQSREYGISWHDFRKDISTESAPTLSKLRWLSNHLATEVTNCN
jgi:hypothetical protein